MRLGRKSLSFSKSVELHDKVIGHYLNINTINKLESLPQRLHKAITESQSELLKYSGRNFIVLEIMICSKTIKTAFQIT